MAILGLAGAGILAPNGVLLPLLWAVGVLPFVGTTSESSLSF